METKQQWLQRLNEQKKRFDSFSNAEFEAYVYSLFVGYPDRDCSVAPVQGAGEIPKKVVELGEVMMHFGKERPYNNPELMFVDRVLEYKGLRIIRFSGQGFFWRIIKGKETLGQWG